FFILFQYFRNRRCKGGKKRRSIDQIKLKIGMLPDLQH
ncbi:Uncharacterized protein BM_BM14124, partial [Brugia malayi]